MRSLRSPLRSQWLSGLLALISLLGAVDLHPALHGALGPMADSHGLAGGEAGIKREGTLSPIIGRAAQADVDPPQSAFIPKSPWMNVLYADRAVDLGI